MQHFLELSVTLRSSLRTMLAAEATVRKLSMQMESIKQHVYYYKATVGSFHYRHSLNGCKSCSLNFQGFKLTRGSLGGR